MLHLTPRTSARDCFRIYTCLHCGFFSVMDHPLNLAHQQSRRADTMLKAKNYEEAIISNKRAAEFVLEALKFTTCAAALESLRLQHAFHLRSAERLQVQQLQAERAQALSSRAEKVTSRTTQTESHLTLPMVDSSIFGNSQTFDSLLPPFLRARQQAEVSEAGGESTGGGVVFTKLPHDDKVIIEELTLHNDDMKRQISMLVREMEKLKMENSNLKHEVQTLQSDKNMTVHENHFSEPLFPSLDLPPLELPEIPDMEIFAHVPDHKFSASE